MRKKDDRVICLWCGKLVARHSCGDGVMYTMCGECLTKVQRRESRQ
jgi:hypothetical protein